MVVELDRLKAKGPAVSRAFSVYYLLLPVYQADRNSTAIQFFLGSGLVSGLGTGFAEVRGLDKISERVSESASQRRFGGAREEGNSVVPRFAL